MANPSQQSSGSDDDSWGKIASDLFGIQFNDADDFELPDDDAPKKPQPAIPVSSSPVLSQAKDEPHPPTETPEEAIEEEVPANVSVPGNEDHDEFWDILESWNWDEAKKEPSKPRRIEESRTNRPRPESAPSEVRRSQRDEPPRREERRPEAVDRPPRRDAEASRETAAPIDDGGRSGRTQRDETRRDRSARTERPQRSRRPETDRPISERTTERSPERQRSREVPAASASDDFGAGVDEPGEPPRSRQVPPVRKRDDSAPPPRKPAPPKRAEAFDEFEEDLFVDDLEDEIVDEDSFVEEEVTGESTSPGSDDDETARPRRRRRRRRRGRGRSPAESATSSESDFEDSSDTEESAGGYDSDEEPLEPLDTGDAEDDSESDEERGPRRPRRRRRRRGRRPEAPAAAETDNDSDEVESVLDDEESDDDEELIHDDDSSDSDDEIVVPISYEGIPTWEEAISYLVIIPPTESRGHHRGRGDGRKR